MTSSNALAPLDPPPRGSLALTSLQDVLTLGDVLARSMFFADARSAAQAVVKILAGRELGFGALASMIGVHIIEGKPSVGSHLLAAAIRSSGRYDYEILEHTDQVCAVRFRRRMPDGSWVNLEPVERLSLAEAQAKGWTTYLDRAGKERVKAPWQKTPKNMLFARCITNGQKFHAPDLFSGLLTYDADELDGAAVAPPAPLPRMPEAVDAGYTVTGPDGSPASLDAVGNTQTTPTAPPVTSPADPIPPASGPETAGPLSETEYQELVALARQHQRTQGEVIAVCRALSIPALQKIPREKLDWARHALTAGLVRTEQADRILALARDLGLDWEKFRARLQAKYQVAAVQHLLSPQADQIEASLKEATAARARETASA